MSKLRLLDLFSGIGGFSFGLERSGGFETVAFCEIEDFPRRVLAKHWPKVPCYHDIRELTAARLAADGIAVDAICGGFPCQDISNAGKQAGIEGERSGLWSEYARLIGELRPRVVFVENVAALLGRGLDRVLGDLAALRYDAVWDCIPASAVGAPHQRDRLWLIAYASGVRCEPSGHVAAAEQGPEAVVSFARRAGSACDALANSTGKRRGEARQLRQRSEEWTAGGGEVLADAYSTRGAPWIPAERHGQEGHTREPYNCGNQLNGGAGAGWWSTEPDVGRVAHGVPNRAHRLKALGNAVVPAIPELLGRAWMEASA